jgi:glycosyltransferase involved in cell wall biosynthesis
VTVRVAHVATVDVTLGVLLQGQLRAQRSAGFEVTTISAPGPWVPALEAAGIAHIPWRHATRGWDPWEDARAFRELSSILRRERFDIVHTHTAKPGVMGRVAARLRRVPVVVNTVHGFDASPDHPFPRRALFMGLEWIAARFSDAELYQSGADLERARRLRMVAPSRSLLIGNGTDLRRFDPAAVNGRAGELRHELGISGSSVVVGTIGRIVAEKGYREFIAAARAVRAKDPEVRFLAVGETDPAKADAIDADELDAAGEDVLFAGWREDVPEVLAAIDVFVLASWREGVPRSAIEASAMGKPLVLSDIPGCREVAREGVEAIFVPPRDAAALAYAISELVADADRAGELGRNARARAVDRFDEDRITAMTIERYERLLERSRARR